MVQGKEVGRAPAVAHRRSANQGTSETARRPAGGGRGPLSLYSSVGCSSASCTPAVEVEQDDDDDDADESACCHAGM